MPDKFSIPVSVDPTGVAPGVAATVEGLGQVEAATTKATVAAVEGGKAVDLAALSNVRSMHHLVAGLFELQSGGVAAIGGLAAEGRVATEVLAGMSGPLAPVLMALTTFTMLAAPMLERFWTKAGEDGKGSADATAEAWREAAKEIDDALGQVLDAQNAVLAADQADIAAITAKGALLDKQAEIDKKRDIEKLRSQYITAEQNPDLTEQQRKQLKEKFDAGEKDIEDNTTIHTAVADRDQRAAEVAGLEKKKADQESQRIANEQTKARLEALRQSAREYIEGQGLTINKDGGIRNANGDDEVVRRKAAVEKAKLEYGFAQQPSRYVSNSAGGGFFVPRSDANVADKKAKVDQADEQLRLLTSAGQNSNLTDNIKSLSDAVKKSAEEIAKTTAQITTAKTELTQAAENVTNAKATADNDKSEQDLKSKTEAGDAMREKTYNDRRATLEKQMSGFEADLKAVGSTPEDAPKRATLEQQIADRAADMIRTKADYDFNGGKGKMDAVQHDAEYAKADDTQRNGASRGAVQEATAAHKETAQQQRLARQQAEQMKREIAARADHKLLEPKIHQIEANSGSDPVAVVAQLQSLLGERMETTAATGSATATALHDHVQKTTAHLAKIDQHLSEHKSKLQSLSNGGNN